MGDYTGAYTVIFRLQECNGWGEGRGILYFKASVVQWKDIRPWQPEYGPEGKHFVSGLFFILGDAAKQ